MRDKRPLHEHGSYHLAQLGRFVTIIGLFYDPHPKTIPIMDGSSNHLDRLSYLDPRNR